MLKKLLWGSLLVASLLLILGARRDLPAAELDARHKTPASRFTTLDDGSRLHYWDRGRSDAPALVLVHGAHDAATTWEEWAPLLEHDFRLIVVDLPGHGLTGRTVTDLYRMEEMVAAVHQLLRRIGVAKAHFAGNSTGGNVVWRYALAHPEQVERMVLLNSWGFPVAGGGKEDSLVTRTLIRFGNPRWLLGYGFGRAVHDQRVLSDERIERWSEFVLREGSRAAHVKRRRLRARSTEPIARLREIAQPTLIVWGDRDRIIPVAYGERFRRELPNSQLLVYRGVGHMPQLEIPARSASDARAFLLSGELEQREADAGESVSTAAAAKLAE